MLALENQLAVVTGAGSGIGEAIAKELSSKGANVFIVDHNEEKAKKVEQEIKENGFEATAYTLDVTSSAQVTSFIKKIEKNYGRLDILVNNAGIAGKPTFISDMEDQAWKEMLEVHVNGTFYFLREASKLMKKNRYGRIVNLSSLAAERGIAGHAHYSASKYAIVGLTEVAAIELGSYNITVNAIKPGLIRTPLSTEGLLSKMEDHLREVTPMKRIGEPSDIARAVLFLVQPDSGFLTGISLIVDGGMNIKDELDKVALESMRLESGAIVK